MTVKLLPTAYSWWAADNFSVSALDIRSHGPVVVDNLSLTNSGTGLNIYTDPGSVTVTNTDANYNTNGINITAGGAITLTNIESRNNTVKGVVLDNDGALSAAAVTVSDLDAWNNGTRGLEIKSIGAVTITNLDASAQLGHGL